MSKENEKALRNFSDEVFNIGATTEKLRYLIENLNDDYEPFAMEHENEKDLCLHAYSIGKHTHMTSILMIDYLAELEHQINTLEDLIESERKMEAVNG